MLITESIPSQLGLVSQCITRLIKQLESLGLSEEDTFSLQLVLEEAIVNAVKHGNRMKSHLSVSVTLQCVNNNLEIIVKDKGDGFDYTHILDPTRAENINKTSGRGIFLMKNLMDRVEFFDNGSGIRLIKSLRKGDNQ